MNILLNSDLFPPLNEPFESFGQMLTENLTWLTEVEEEAASALKRDGQWEMLPKTPAQRTKRKRKMPSRSQSNASRASNVAKELPPKGKQVEIRPPEPGETPSVASTKDLPLVKLTEPKPPETEEQSSVIEEQQRITWSSTKDLHVAKPALAKPPVTEDQPSVIEEQPPVIEEQPPVIEEQQKRRSRSLTKDLSILKSTEAKPLVLEEQAHVTEEQQKWISRFSTKDLPVLKSTEAKPPVFEEQPLVITEQPHVIKELPPVIKEQPPVIEEQQRMTRSKARPKVQKIAAAAETLLSPKRVPLKSPMRFVSSANKVRPVSTDKSSGSRLFGFGSATKNMPSTFVRTSSFNNLSKFNKAPSSNMPANYSSFVKRNTPLKQSKQEIESNLKEKLQQQEERQKEAANKKDDIMRAKIEETKKKREERMQRVAAAKEQKLAETEQIKRKLEEKNKAIANLKEQEEQRQKKKQKSVAQLKLNVTKDPESYETTPARQPKPSTDINYNIGDLNSSAETEQVKRKLEEKNKTIANLKEQEEQHQQKKQKSFEKQKSIAQLKLNVTKDPESYEITPARQPKPSTDTNYDIGDLNSSDDTDDEEAPRKKIPFWAQGAALKAAMVQQYYTTIDTDALFHGALQVPNLLKLFNSNKKRFHHRTSSAVWNEASFQAFHDEDLHNV